jgi:hypothetical protein
MLQIKYLKAGSGLYVIETREVTFACWAVFDKFNTTVTNVDKNSSLETKIRLLISWILSKIIQII